MFTLYKEVAIITGSFPSHIFAQEKPLSNITATPPTLIPAITQNVLTIVSILMGTSSFILGLRMQSLTKSISSTANTPYSMIINKYMETLILALAVPSVFIIIFGIILVGEKIEPGDVAYLTLLFALFIPAGVVLFLVRNLRRISQSRSDPI